MATSQEVPKTALPQLVVKRLIRNRLRRQRVVAALNVRQGRALTARKARQQAHHPLHRCHFALTLHEARRSPQRCDSLFRKRLFESVQQFVSLTLFHSV